MSMHNKYVHRTCQAMFMDVVRSLHTVREHCSGNVNDYNNTVRDTGKNQPRPTRVYIEVRNVRDPVDVIYMQQFSVLTN